MSVVVSLLRAIDRADGEALVMHVGEKPYVVTAAGHAEIASKPLTVPAMTGMLDQLLPADSRQALNEVGAVEYHLPVDQTNPGLRYSVVAARGGDDIWIEVRRRKEAPEPAPAIVQQQSHVAPAAPAPTPAESATPFSNRGVAVAVEDPQPEPMMAPPIEPEPEPEYEPAPVMHFEEPEPVAIAEPEPIAIVDPEPVALTEPESVVITEPEPVAFAAPEPIAMAEPEPIALAEPEPVAIAEPEPVVEQTFEPEPFDAFRLTTQTEDDFYRVPEVDEDGDDDDDFGPHMPAGPAFDFSVHEPDPEPAPVAAAVVVPMARVNIRLESPVRPAHVDPLHHLLQVGAAHGASALYVAALAKPSLRVDGEIHVLDEAPLSEAELEAGLRALLGTRSHGASFPVGEIEPFDVPNVGRVQFFGFRDHRGLGGVFKMLPARAVSAQHIGLSSPIQTLCTEPEGLVLVAGAHSSGKSTLVAALVDQINRTRRDHVITVEKQIQFVHENQTAFVSQREARDEGAFIEAVRTAIRESPDVLVIDDVMNGDVARAVLEAVVSGHMVVASVPSTSTAGALQRFMEFFGPDRGDARAAIAEHLRGVIMQTLLRKTGGGRAAAREVLVNVPSVSTLIAEGQFDQLGSVMNGGRRIGMVPLNDALLALVQGGSLDVRQAYRKSPDQTEFVTMLNKAGMDTSFADRLA